VRHYRYVIVQDPDLGINGYIVRKIDASALAAKELYPASKIS
jgi:hypothetical protein